MTLIGGLQNFLGVHDRRNIYFGLPLLVLALLMELPIDVFVWTLEPHDAVCHSGDWSQHVMHSVASCL